MPDPGRELVITSYSIHYTKLYELPVGQLSDVVTTPFGFHLVEVEERRAQRDVPFVITSYSIHYTKLYEAPSGSPEEPGRS